ncbi:MAG: putative metal-binding motif-containing protein [Deltaproteobacteria bacterium]|nr:putative metal-binding motif-containing protein [Deltaproteobacteria bacterium]
MGLSVWSVSVAAAAALAVFLVAGCSKFEQRAGPGGFCTKDTDCLVGHSCNPSGICEALPAEPQPEPMPEPEPDAVEPVEATDPGPEETTVLTEVDITEDEHEVEDVPDAEDVPPDDARPEDGPDAEVGDATEADAPAKLPVGGACEADGDCEDGACSEVVPGLGGAIAKKVCTGPCVEGEFCPAGMACVPVTKLESGYRYECRPLPLGLCRECTIADDCAMPGAQCLGVNQALFCSAPCPPDGEGNPGECPEGFDCKVIPGLPEESRHQCIPVIGTCACDGVTQSQTFTCSIAAGGDRCWGEMDCTPGKGWGKCPAFLPEPGVCHDRRPNCLEPSLDAFPFADWDYSTKLIGDACGTGVCAGGTVTCGAAGAATCSSLGSKAAEEFCGDFKDNDCDGKTEESPPCDPIPDDIDGDGESNDTDCDADDPAKHHTVPGKLPAVEPCCPPGIPAFEEVAVCDYDCDGAFVRCEANDEDHDGYVAVGKTDAAGNPGDDCDDSDPHIFPNAPEYCGDGIDQDCLEGDLACGDVQDKDGDKYGTKWDTSDNDPKIHPWADEVCNYKDDDCDGVVDDGNPGGQDKDGIWHEGGSDCGSNVGECRFGSWTCTHFPVGAYMVCLFAAGPTEETCNGKDDDCNGITDDPWVAAGASRVKGDKCDGSDLDQCRNGLWSCAPDGKSLECIETVWDVVEVCANKKDDDCDTVVDNGCFPEDLDGDGYLPDAADPQLRDCDNLKAGTHPGALEKCCDPVLSGAAALKACDRNCDGVVTPCGVDDEDMDGFAPPGDCDDSDPKTFKGAPEKCGDGKDQDCDGVDIPCGTIQDGDKDGFAPPGDCDDSDPTRYPGAPELCNLLDDDCDKNIDNGNPEGGAPCGSAVGECRPGILVCVHYPYTAKVECVPERGPSREICNGRDDNCNGLTDEYFPDLKKPCDGPDADSCKNGVMVCSADGTGTVCGPELVENLKEVCDGKDNDCDGLTDEGFLYLDPSGQNLPLGAQCEGYGECGAGVVECATDQHRATCSTNADGTGSQALPEQCDGKDQDCDGVADNGIYYQGLAMGELCLGFGACGLGRVECNKEGGPTCSSNPDGSKPKAKVEKCNGADDDCDGHTDEGVVATAWDCKRGGVCAGVKIPAACRKGAWQCDYSAVPGYLEVELTCDSIDNNCDGRTDEGFPYQDATVGQSCAGIGECGPGTVVCVSESESTCSSNPNGPAHNEKPETCNGKDDDCNGVTDDGFKYLGAPPAGECDGVGECGAGVVVCTADGTKATCSTNPDGSTPQAAVDTCNGLDDDCDGQTDEDYPVGQGCDGPDPDLCAAGRYQCNGDGSWVDCIGDETGMASDEVCDGKDNNCDGKTDEAFTYDGLPIGEPCQGIGACGLGVVECADLYRATCSTNPDGSNRRDGPEVCNGQDDDCDGGTDEKLTWQGVALAQPCVAPGECGAGTVVCSPGDLVATCSTLSNGTEPRSGPETCDGEDDDCNGLTDDVAGQDLSGCRLTGVCNGQNVRAICANAQWNCDYSGVPDYMDVETGCDMKDNDCNGTTDDGYAWQGLPIGAGCDGVGACGAGTVVCSPAGTGATCSTNPDGTAPQNVKEVCTPTGGTPADEDCDGELDEEGATYCVGYYLDEDSDKYGKSGAKKCLCAKGQPPWDKYTASVALDCDDNDPEVHPKHPELCNGKDDNCDGKKDETFPTKGQACAGPPPNDQCMNGTITCTADGTAVECTGYHVSPETCNGKDDDCDGQTDEVFAWNAILPGKPCDGTGECGAGTVVCISDTEATCSTNANGPASQAKAETCNARDDDCDGTTDEDWPDKSKPCDGPDADLCKQGTWTCTLNGSGIECVNEPNPPVPSTIEKCDHIDNDCNGTTDDPWTCAGVGPDAPCKSRKCDVKTNPIGGPACKTGWWSCNVAKDGLDCVNEVECAYGATCKSSGVDTLPDECHCGTHSSCTTYVANQCQAGSDCKCGSGPACTGTLRCIQNTCKVP